MGCGGATAPATNRFRSVCVGNGPSSPLTAKARKATVRQSRVNMRELIVCAVIILSVPSLAARAQGIAEHQDLRSVPSIVLAEIDRERLLTEDEAQMAAPGPMRFAISSAVFITPQSAGVAEPIGNGTNRWRLRIYGPRARNLNFVFGELSLYGARPISGSPGGHDRPTSRSRCLLWTSRG